MSSLIYENPWLVQELIKAGEDFENKFLKKGQAAQTGTVGQALSALLTNLREQISNTKLSPGEFFPTNQSDLASQHMDSLGDFVQWMDTVGKRDIAVKVDQTRSNRPNENYYFCSLEPGTEILVPMKVPDRSPVAYWVNPETLKSYLVALQADPKLKNNVMFQVQLLKLIQDANKQLDLGVEEKYQATVDDGQEIDRLPRVLDPAHPLAKGNEVILQYKDVKSASAFHAWLGSSKISVKDKSGAASTIGDENFNQCAVINVLYTRAQTLESLYTEESKMWSAAYVKQVSQIAVEVKCTLASGQQNQTQQPGQQGQISPQQLQHLASLKPFDAQRIKFQEIQLFVNEYAKLSNRPDMQQQAEKVNAAIAEATGMMGGSTAPLPLNGLSTTIVKSWAPSPLLLLNALWSILDNAGRMYSDFYENFKRFMEPSTAQSVLQQITNGGPQNNNINNILRVRSSLMSETPGMR